MKSYASLSDLSGTDRARFLASVKPDNSTPCASGQHEKDEMRGWAELARKARRRWMRDNP